MVSSIEKFANERGIKSLFHFTRLDNLPSILTHGLLNKAACACAGVTPAINDPYRFDGTGAISSTISFPNYRMFYRLRCDNPNIEWVVLELDASLLWRTACAFSSTNAGDSSAYRIPISHRQGLPALESMFSDYGLVQRATLNIPENYTTNPQAEVLLLEGAIGDYGKRVYFQQQATLQKYKAEWPNIPSQLDNGYFRGRLDYKYWR